MTVSANPIYPKRITIGKVECIMRQYEYSEVDIEFVDKAVQTPTPKVASAKRDRIDRRIKQSAERRNTTSFIPYIRKIVQSSPAMEHLTISQQAMQEVNDLLHDVMQNLSTEAGEMCHQVKRKTLLAKDIQAATKLSFPPSMYEASRKYAHKRLSKFKQSRK